MTVVRFAAYRSYEAARVEASNAMMALLAGAQLASHLLLLSDGSSQLLPAMYPRVPHIGRFNLTSDAAWEARARLTARSGSVTRSRTAARDLERLPDQLWLQIFGLERRVVCGRVAGRSCGPGVVRVGSRRRWRCCPSG